MAQGQINSLFKAFELFNGYSRVEIQRKETAEKKIEDWMKLI